MSCRLYETTDAGEVDASSLRVLLQQDGTIYQIADVSGSTADPLLARVGVEINLVSPYIASMNLSDMVSTESILAPSLDRIHTVVSKLFLLTT